MLSPGQASPLSTKNINFDIWYGIRQVRSFNILELQWLNFTMPAKMCKQVKIGLREGAYSGKVFLRMPSQLGLFSLAFREGHCHKSASSYFSDRFLHEVSIY